MTKLFYGFGSASPFSRHHVVSEKPFLGSVGPWEACRNVTKTPAGNAWRGGDSLLCTDDRDEQSSAGDRCVCGRNTGKQRV